MVVVLVLQVCMEWVQSSEKDRYEGEENCSYGKIRKLKKEKATSF